MLADADAVLAAHERGEDVAERDLVEARVLVWTLADLREGKTERSA